jgi:small-conductance mechanosensitive channel
VLFTRYIEVGDEIRVFSPRLPYDRASSPAYKFFSPDYVYVGYRGRVVDVGLLYSTMVTDEGLELKIPNTVIFDAAIVNYRPRYSSSRIYQVRYEYKVDFDPEMVLGMVKKALADIREVREVVLNEQSDKEYQGKVPGAGGGKLVPSEV